MQPNDNSVKKFDGEKFPLTFTPHWIRYNDVKFSNVSLITNKVIRRYSYGARNTVLEKCSLFPLLSTTFQRGQLFFMDNTTTTTPV